jgi:TatD DNase family protein
MYIDTHAHLQWSSFDNDREQVIDRAIEKGVTRIVNIGFDLQGSVKGVALADKYDQLYATIGIHPHNASMLNTKTLDVFRKLVDNPKVVAIGEIGLDYYRNLSPRHVQKQAFETQLDLAQELNLPVIVYDRESHNDIIQMLTKYKGKIRGIMHCFSGNKEFAKQCIDLDFMVSFAGTATYPNAHDLHQIAIWIDQKNMLLETDCPWLAPQTMRGKRNEPSFLPLTAQKIAQLKNMNIKDIAKITTQNAEALFKL